MDTVHLKIGWQRTVLVDYLFGHSVSTTWTWANGVTGGLTDTDTILA